jgi:hypothetical protein
MNAKQQQEMAERVEDAFGNAGIIVEEPFNDGGNRRYAPCTNWPKLIAYLARSGYRLSLERRE